MLIRISNDDVRSGRSPQDRGGFSLVEMLAVLVILSILVGLLSSALNHTRTKSYRIHCLDNLRQLGIAWMMYADDNEQRLALNQTDPTPVHRRIYWRRNSSNSWVMGSPLEDVDTSGIQAGTLYPYSLDAQIYRCPMDAATVPRNPGLARSRSYSMNVYLAGDNAGQDSRVKVKYNELISPKSDDVFVFIEEHEASIWVGGFVVNPGDNPVYKGKWISTPSDRHYQGANLTFADGHVEFWKWFTPKTTNLYNFASTSSRELTDLLRLQNSLPKP